MELKDILSLLITILFAISALAMAVAQLKSAEATDLILESFIEYQDQNLYRNLENTQLSLVSDQHTLALSQLVHKNYICLVTILLNNIAVNQTIYQEFAYNCLNSTNLEIAEYDDFGSNLTKPIIEYKGKLSEIHQLRIDAITWQYVSFTSFGVGIILFISLIYYKSLEYIIKKYQDVSKK